MVLRLAAAAALLLTACSGGGGAADGGHEKGDKAKAKAEEPATGPILIGEYGSMTGSEATFGKSTHNGIVLALEQINAAGGVNGRPLELRSYDDQGKTQEAGTVVTRLITEDKVVAVLGEVSSSLSQAGGRVAQQYGIPMISPSSTNASVTRIGPMIFRVCFVDEFQGYVGAKFASENLKVTKVASLYDQSSAYSKGLKDDFAKAFTAMGGQVLTEQAYTAGDQELSAQLGNIKGAGVEALYIPGYYTDVGNIAIQARKIGLNVPLLGGDGWDSAKLAEIGKDAIEGAYYSNHYAPEEARPEVQKFVTDYKARYEGAVPDGLAALGYDATRVLAEALGRSKSTDGAELAAAIAQTRNFAGVTGSITIDADRNAQKPAVVVQMKGGVPTFAASVTPEGAAGPDGKEGKAGKAEEGKAGKAGGDGEGKAGKGEKAKGG